MDVVSLYMDPPERAVVLGVDEESQSQASERSQRSLPLKPERAGSVVCWGSNSKGQSRPPSVPFTYVATGWNHARGIATNGTASCWGADQCGEASPPKASSPLSASATPGLRSQTRRRPRMLGRNSIEE